MREHNKDLRDCPTAYECRDRLPALSAWMSEDLLKEIPIYQGDRFERGQLYFDLDNPKRGAFVASGDKAPIVDHTYACRNQMSERAWAQLITWQQPVSEEQGLEIEVNRRAFDFGRERSAAGEARPLPPE